ncbi:MAG TPA: metallophosphoesterase family protein [Verrucomicrobiae bacterium]
MKIGVISDTHGFLEPAIFELFAGVEHILHAGDIGYASIILELEAIAPVTAVHGNTDMGMSFRETEIVELAARKFLVHHIVNPYALSDRLKPRIARDKPEVVVFGHTHKAFNEKIGGVLFFNPGYSGKPKGGTERSAAILHCDEKGIRAEFMNL